MSIRLIGKIYGQEVLNFININKICINDIIKHKITSNNENYYIVIYVSENYIKVRSLITMKNDYGLDFFYNNKAKEIYLHIETYSMIMYFNIQYPQSYMISKLVNIHRINTPDIFCFLKINISNILIILTLLSFLIISYHLLNPSHYIYYFFISILFIHSIVYYKSY